jgi:periplasmic divalent cation tolerance protein
MKIYFIYVTFGSLREAKRLGGQLVKNKLAACTNIIPTIYSTYVWKNKTMTDKECSMIVKTSKSRVKAAIKFIVKKHSNESPAVSAFPIELTHTDFQRWINEQTMTKLK